MYSVTRNHVPTNAAQDYLASSSHVPSNAQGRVPRCPIEHYLEARVCQQWYVLFRLNPVMIAHTE
jgi:hypothetical protein